MNTQSTICAIATAQGGAIGVIRVSGPEAITITAKVFRGRHTLKDAKGYSLHYGTIVSPVLCSSAAEHHGVGETVIDDVLVSVFRAPHSYTGEDSVEISAHGSAYILQQICQTLIANGCTPASPGEYTQRAFLNGKMDLSQAEAVADLIASQTASQHRVAMSQMRGGISNKLSALREQLLKLTSLLELELDFSEEDVEFASRQQLLDIAKQVAQEITRLTTSFSTGNAIKNGVPVAIIGAPNVGKSTLLNALLRDDRAIVSDIQGTTRDLIEDTVYITNTHHPSPNAQGVLFRFIDTAGIRHTDDTIEKLGIERSRQAAEKAQIIILMTEEGVAFPDVDVKDEQIVVKVLNKCDLHNDSTLCLSVLSDASHNDNILRISAKQGEGISALEQALISALPQQNNDDVLITNLRHKQALDNSLADINRVIPALEQNLPGDLIAEDLRQCLSHLAEITGGEITSDEVLGNIFSHFCIGK